MRRHLQEETSPEAIRAFLDANEFCCLSVCDGDTPYIVPLHYGYTLTSEGCLTLYFHAAVAGRLFDIAHKAPGVAAAFAIAVSPGLLPAEDPCRWSAVYQSILGEGTLSPVTEPAEKAQGLAVLMGCLAKGAYREKPGQFDAALAKTAVYRLAVSDYHMKRSVRGPEVLG